MQMQEITQQRLDDNTKLTDEYNTSQIVSKELKQTHQNITLQEKKSLITLTLLYFIQGIPLGFFGGALAILLTEAGVHFKELAIISIVTLPFSFKMLTAPILDTFYSHKIGKRRTYILPIQYLMSVIFLLMSIIDIQTLIVEKEVMTLTILGLVTIFLTAQQDIAVDGWVLTCLSDKNVHLGASCQSIGQILGSIYGSNLLINLNSVSFCNSFLFSQPQDQPLVSISQFCKLTGILILIINLYVQFFTIEKEEADHVKLKQTQTTPLQQFTHSIQNVLIMMKNQYVLMLVLFLLTQRLGVQPMYSSFGTILQQNGFSKELLSTISTCFIPLGVIIPLFVGSKLMMGQNIIMKLYILRMFDVAFQYFIVIIYDRLGGFNNVTATLSIIAMFISYCNSQVAFVIHIGFYNRISDSDVGGTYLTFLNSAHNLGNSIASSLSLYLIDLFGLDSVFMFSMIFAIIYYLKFHNQIGTLQTISKDSWKLQKLIE